MSKLAINGGKPVRKKMFPVHNFIGHEEKKAAIEVLDSGVLSQFLGSWDPIYFYGGHQTRFATMSYDWGCESGFSVLRWSLCYWQTGTNAPKHPLNQRISEI